MIGYPLSFAAGALSTLSPCVLPALPLLVGGALQEHRHAPAAMAAGLIFSSTLIGFAVAATGDALGLSPVVLRSGAAVLLMVSGGILLSQRLQDLLSRFFSPLVSMTGQHLQSRRLSGLGGQFVLGTLLGVLWSPCAGPTIGAAIGLASEAGGRLTALGMMFLFGLGAAVPLLMVAYGGRKLLASRRESIGRALLVLRPLFGVLLLLMGVLVLTRLDKKLEALLLSAMGERWLSLVTGV